jgi:hypothetical protein
MNGNLLLPALAIGGAFLLMRGRKDSPTAKKQSLFPAGTRLATAAELKTLKDGKYVPATTTRVHVVPELWFRSGPRGSEGPVRAYGAELAIGDLTLEGLKGITTVVGWF